MANCRFCSLGRRDFIKIAFGASASASLSGRFLLPLTAASLPAKAKSVILLWMHGGPSQLDTFDPKPGTEHGGPHKAIETKTQGLRVSEYLPRLALASTRYSVIRSLFSKDPNHDTARYLLHTGYRTDPTIDHPHLGSMITQELGTKAEGLPGCVALGKDPGASSGYLAPELAPLLVEKIDNPLEDLKVAKEVTSFRLADRENLLRAQNRGFAADHADSRVDLQQKAYERAFGLMRSPHLKAFDLSGEKEETQQLYGNSPFGRACLMARRLVEAGVRFVEVTLADWDSHSDNFNRTRTLMGQLDPAFSGLLADLEQRRMLDETLILWMGEFGRTPKINGGNGRDHWTRSFCAALAGGGLHGGRVIGRTNPLGTEISDRPVSVQDLFATVYGQLGIDVTRKYMSQAGRPVRILEGGEPIKEILS